MARRRSRQGEARAPETAVQTVTPEPERLAKLHAAFIAMGVAGKLAAERPDVPEGEHYAHWCNRTGETEVVLADDFVVHDWTALHPVSLPEEHCAKAAELGMEFLGWAAP